MTDDAACRGKRDGRSAEPKPKPEQRRPELPTHLGKVGCLPAPRGYSWIAAVAVTRPIGRVPSGASPAGGRRLSTPASGAGPAATSSGTCRQVLRPAAAPADDVPPPVAPGGWTVLGGAEGGGGERV